MLLLFINVHLIVVHLILLSTFITIVITSLFLLFLYQLEEHMTYLVCEVELNKKKLYRLYTPLGRQLRSST